MINYYKTLNVEPDATQKAIKKAYKREASKWHPDKNHSPEATSRMQDINEAYLILGDEEARIRFDKEYKFYESSYSKNNYGYTYTEKNNNESSQNNSYAKQDYNFKDDILKDWINKAKNQAKTMTKQSLEDLFGMSHAASKAAYDATKNWILALIITVIIIIILNAI